MKKFLALLCAALMLFAAVACTADTPAEETKATVETKDLAAKSEGVMTYEQFAAAELNTEVTVETYVQAKQGWWEKDGQGVITVYTQDTVGGYFLYNMACTEEDAAKLVAGTKIKVHGYKSEWAGEVEITDATFEFVDDGCTYVATAVDMTEFFSANDWTEKKNANMLFAVKGAEVVAANDAGDAFMYNWDGSGSEGDDLYYNVKIGETTYTFVVESYLCGKDTDTYKAVQALKVGDKIDVEAFLYWYDSAQAHTVSVKTAA